MRLCHPDDVTIEFTARDLVLRASCHAPKCGRVYGKYHQESPIPHLAVLIDRHLYSDTWACFSSVERLLNEMRCRHEKFCSNCQNGGSLTECKGIEHA